MSQSISTFRVLNFINRLSAKFLIYFFNENVEMLKVLKLCATKKRVTCKLNFKNK